jgi:hypothetical protein
MKSTQFISTKRKKSLIEVPHRKSLTGKTEEESSLAGDIVSGLDEQCLKFVEYLPL